LARKAKGSATTPLSIKAKALWSALGPVEVRETAEGLEGDFGEWDAEQRVVKIKPGMHPKTAEHTTMHEWVHLILWDAGLTAHFPPNLEELVCDALATALVASNT
jgi:hypothetical protein